MSDDFERKKKEREAAFNAVFLANYDNLVLYTMSIYRRITGRQDRAWAEDVVQDTFFLLWQHFEVYQAHDRPKSWLYKAVNLTMKNALRADRRWDQLLLRAQSIAVEAVTPDLAAVIEPEPSKQELAQILSPPDYELLVMMDQAEGDRKAVAARLGLSRNTFDKRLSRIRSQVLAYRQRTHKKEGS